MDKNVDAIIKLDFTSMYDKIIALRNAIISSKYRNIPGTNILSINDMNMYMTISPDSFFHEQFHKSLSKYNKFPDLCNTMQISNKIGKSPHIWPGRKRIGWYHIDTPYI